MHAASACYGNRDMGNMVAAASDSFWNGAVCGRCYRVKCTGAAYGGSGNPCKGGSSDGCQSTIDLSKQAFAKIANLDAGEVKVDFNSECVLYTRLRIESSSDSCSFSRVT